MAIGMNFNPAQVMMGQSNIRRAGTFGDGSSGNQSPYLPTNGPPQPKPAGGNVLGPESIRATGSGPFDPAYRQNLASYAGSQFMRPGGNMNFNPTDPSSLSSMGQATGGGNSPVMGSPTGLLDQALGGQPFSFTPPPQGPAQTPQGNPSNYWQFWLKQFSNPMNNMRMPMTQSY